jgi:hypothetical protein
MQQASRVVQAAPRKTPQPTFLPTGMFLLGLMLTALFLREGTPSEIARIGAIGVGLSLAASLLVEAAHSRANLLRTDVVMLVTLYGLTFLEFLFPQPGIDQQISDPDEISFGVQACLIAFGGLSLGRHLGSSRRRTRCVSNAQLSPNTLVLLFWTSFGIGFLYMLLAVDFNPVALVHYFLEPRFGQPWQRGKFGDWKALLGELGALIYLVPPIGGIVLGRIRIYSKGCRCMVLLATVFTMFYGFSSGTRNVTAVFAITFSLGYFFGQGRILTHRVRAVVILSAFAIAASAYYGLQFRNIGLGRYLAGGREETVNGPPSLFIDNDLFIISRLTGIFPSQHDFIGMAVPLWIIARPVPRALWPNKPDGSDVSAETYLDPTEDVTLASTFVGESFMAAGFLGVAIAGICMGMLGRWWSARTYSIHSDFGVLIYTSGFFALLIGIRSLYQLPVAALPTLGAIAFRLGVGRGSSRHLV